MALFNGSIICIMIIIVYISLRKMNYNSKVVELCIKRLFKLLFQGLRSHIGSQLIYEDENIKNSKGIMLYHPHGILSLGMLSTLHDKNILSIGQHFKIPIWREILLSLGFSTSSKKDIISVGEPVMSLGGGRESLLIGGSDGSVKFLIKKRRGIFKLAKETGIPLIPVIGFGEIALYEVRRPNWYAIFEEIMLDNFHFTIPIFWGLWGTWIPKRRSGGGGGGGKFLVVVGGKQIWVRGTIDEGIEEYCKELNRIYFKYRMDERELEII